MSVFLSIFPHEKLKIEKKIENCSEKFHRPDKTGLTGQARAFRPARHFTSMGIKHTGPSFDIADIYLNSLNLVQLIGTISEHCFEIFLEIIPKNHFGIIFHD